MKQGDYLTSYTKINPKWIEVLNIRPDIARLIEGNVGDALLDIGLDDDLGGLMPKAKATKEKIYRTASNLNASAEQKKYQQN